MTKLMSGLSETFDMKAVVVILLWSVNPRQRSQYDFIPTIQYAKNCETSLDVG